MLNDDPLTRPLTNTELSTFRRCKRQWWLGWYRRLKPVKWEDPTSPLSIGSAVHRVLQAWYRCEGPLDRLLQELAPDDDWTAAICEGYLQWLAETGADQGLEVLTVEVVHEALLPVVERKLRAKADIRFRDSEGRIVVMDHKTGDLKRPTAHLETQPLHYLLVERLKGAGAAPWALAFWHNRMRRVKRTARAKPPFYARDPIYKTDIELKAYMERIIEQVIEMERFIQRLEVTPEKRRHLVAYPTPSDRCSWDCPFFSVCGLMDQGRADAEVVIELAYKEGDPLAHHGTEPVA